MSDRPGRNDLCYCGSGKKYKKCHMPADQAAEQEKRAVTEAVRYLRRDLLKFARDERFAEDFARALPLYWNDLYTVENAEEMSQAEALRFFDWFTFDDVLADGSRLADLYRAERWDDLSSPQQAVLANWQEAGPAGAYELAGYEGQTLSLRDFVTGAAYNVYEPAGRGNVEVGEVILVRLVTIGDHLEFSTSAAYLPAAEIADLANKLAAAQAADAEANPGASHDDFMRRHNHLLVHHALEQAQLQGRPPVARLDPDRPDKKTQKLARNIKRLR